jgi:hypothetical protein
MTGHVFKALKSPVLRQAILCQLVPLSLLSFLHVTSRLSSLVYLTLPLLTRRLRMPYHATMPMHISVISSWNNLPFSPSPFLPSLAWVLESPRQRLDLRQQHGLLNHTQPIQSDFGNLKLSPSELDSAKQTHKCVDTMLRAYKLAAPVRQSPYSSHLGPEHTTNARHHHQPAA